MLMEHECPTFTRNCEFRVSCCGARTCCLGCHRQRTDHPTSTRDISHMICKTCHKEHLVAEMKDSKTCENCKQDLASYACFECMVFESNKNIFHCPFCKSCKYGKAGDFSHCSKCGFCISRGGSNKQHICYETNTRCEICWEEFKESTAHIIQLVCGHFMHSGCWQDTFQNCPICRAVVAERKSNVEPNPDLRDVDQVGLQMVYCSLGGWTKAAVACGMAVLFWARS